MALRKRGQWRYGDSHLDVREELSRFGRLNESVPTHFAEAKCECASAVFRLALDDNEGAAVRTCLACGRAHPIGDSEEFLASAELAEAGCPCGGEVFEVTVGVSLSADSHAVKWLYLGCRCPTCGLTAVYGDWKNEFEDYRQLLTRV